MALLLPSPFQMIFEARNETTKQAVQNPRNQSLISALFGPNDGVHLTSATKRSWNTRAEDESAAIAAEVKSQIVRICVIVFIVLKVGGVLDAERKR